MLLNLSPRTGPPPTTQNYPTQSVDGGKVVKLVYNKISRRQSLNGVKGRFK